MIMRIPDFSSVAHMMDSVYVERAGSCLMEQYWEPYDKDSLHRMFSVTKSYCCLAVLALAADGRLALSDHVIDYFPEYVVEPVHPWLAEMTIRHMLTMQTCHSRTTFHTGMTECWVESFFTTTPSHRPGQVFQYDTSSSHTLAALVEKLTGQGILDYLRGIVLEKAGFSREAYILKDPFGTELGGSGLMAKTLDLACTARVLMALQRGSFLVEASYQNCITDRYPKAFWVRYSELVKDALACQTPTCHFGQTVDEQQGYGMQFWRMRDGGAAMYGLGGQYAILYPQEELFVVTTADTQNIKGGSQSILDCINRYVKALRREPAKRAACELTLQDSWTGSYGILQEESDFSSISLEAQMLTLYRKENGSELCIPFSLTQGTYGNLQLSGCRNIYTKAAVLPGSYLQLQIKNYDICIGLLQILIHFEADGTICMYMRTVGIEEYEMFNGFFDGRRKG